MTESGPQVAVLSFQGGDLVGGGQLFRLSTPGGSTFLVTAPRGRAPDLDGIYDDPTPVGIERVLRRNDQLHWLRLERDGGAQWHPAESEARVALSDDAWVVCYGTRQVPGWLVELARSAHVDVVLRMGAAAGLDVASATFSSETALQAGPVDGSAWTPGRHLGTGVQGLWAWSTASWARALAATAVFALAIAVFSATVTAFDPAPRAVAPHGPPGVGIPGSGLPPLELDPCEVLAGGGKPATAVFCQRVVARGAVDPDFWYLAGSTTREIRADIQGLHALSQQTQADVYATWAPVLGALFAKLLLIEFMPSAWGAELTQAGGPLLGPTRPAGESPADFAVRFPALLGKSPPWITLWESSDGAPDPVELHRELFGSDWTLAAHGELLAAAQR